MRISEETWITISTFAHERTEIVKALNKHILERQSVPVFFHPTIDTHILILHFVKVIEYSVKSGGIVYHEKVLILVMFSVEQRIRVTNVASVYGVVGQENRPCSSASQIATNLPNFARSFSTTRGGQNAIGM